MMKLLLLISILLSTFNAFAKSSESEKSQVIFPICSLYYAKTVKKKLLPTVTNDKYKHCAVSCMLANRCGAADALEIGIYKELWDLVSPGDADWLDIKADLVGISFSRKQSAINDYECNTQCKNVDWTRLK
jgi:hypothetical protein